MFYHSIYGSNNLSIINANAVFSYCYGENNKVMIALVLSLVFDTVDTSNTVHLGDGDISLICWMQAPTSSNTFNLDIMWGLSTPCQL